MFDDVKMTKGKVGANTINKDDGISALIVSSSEIPGITYNHPYVFYSIEDVKQLGISPQTDADNEVNVFRHLSEYFRMSSYTLHFMLVEQSATISSICEDVTAAKKLLLSAKGKVRQLAIAINTIDPTIHLDGLPQQLIFGIPKAQGLAAWAYDNAMPCNILLEGYEISLPSASILNLRSLNAPKVSVFIGQDYNYAASNTGKAKYFADVGTTLGVLSSAKINQNIGDNEIFNITDTVTSSWIEPGVSSHQKITDISSDLKTLDSKGYIFGVTYVGLDGVRFNSDHTCVEIKKDEQGNVNEHTIAYGRTLDKAVRELTRALLPKVKSTHPVNPKTGFLPIGVIKYFEELGNAALERMRKAKEISAGKTYINPQSDQILAKVLESGFSIIPYGNISKINGRINLKTKI